MTVSPQDLLAEPPIRAAVAALAERNRHHYESMSEGERAEAVGHWRELAMSVLTAAAATLERPPGAEPEPEPLGPGRAVVVFEDVGGDQVTVQASFFPELQDVGDGGVAGTAAQAMALELLQEMAGEAQDEPE